MGIKNWIVGGLLLVSQAVAAQPASDQIVIGNIDGYPALGHTELTGRNAVYRHFTYGTFNPNSWNADHASMVTSIINGSNTGIAKNAYVWTIPIWSPYDRSVYGSNTGLLNAYRRLISLKARVINHELNSTDVSGQPARTWTRGRLEVISQVPQVVFVQPMGNNGQVIPNQNYTKNLSTLNHLLLVGAVDDNNRITSWSNRPGENCFYLVCREEDKYKYRWVVAPGVNVYGAGSPGGYLRWSGTSFAAPKVSGTLALMLEKNPSLTSQEAVRIILETATDLGDPGPDPIYGVGLLNTEGAVASVQ